MLPLLKFLGITLFVAAILALSAERCLSGRSSVWDLLSLILMACWILWEAWQRFYGRGGKE